MTKRGVKFLMIVIMILGISFSIVNFLSMETGAFGIMGEWEDLGSGVDECMGNGTECIINGFSPY